MHFKEERKICHLVQAVLLQIRKEKDKIKQFDNKLEKDYMQLKNVILSSLKSDSSSFNIFLC